MRLSVPTSVGRLSGSGSMTGPCQKRLSITGAVRAGRTATAHARAGATDDTTGFASATDDEPTTRAAAISDLIDMAYLLRKEPASRIRRTVIASRVPRANSPRSNASYIVTAARSAGPTAKAA